MPKVRRPIFAGRALGGVEAGRRSRVRRTLAEWCGRPILAPSADAAELPGDAAAMHVLFIHPNFPAQFGHLANHLATRLGWQCTVLTSVDTTHLSLPFTHINYKVKPGPQPKVFYNPNSLDGMLEHLTAVYTGMKSV